MLINVDTLPENGCMVSTKHQLQHTIQQEHITILLHNLQHSELYAIAYQHRNQKHL